ncbi:hypothetical protein [Evansella halocellulosilytica]|uniref:hypothetical protein n=1 Tax=Evansella halocellulosilytica TaxID=2011013 RepID=UPI000BB8A6F8|nr:hypothetical protein [Evansella halocellulosilytica]
MRNIVYFMTFAIALLPMAGCSTSAQTELYEIIFENEGETIETGEFQTYEVKIKGHEGERQSVDSVYLYMNMERMNHPMEGTMDEIEKGYYQIDLPLAMEGEWYAEVTVTNNGEESIQRFTLFGEGDMVMDYMKGYNADY